jgi:hypothetical protein
MTFMLPSDPKNAGHNTGYSDNTLTNLGKRKRMELVDHDEADPVTLLFPSDPKTGVTTLDSSIFDIFLTLPPVTVISVYQINYISKCHTITFSSV